MPDDNAWNVKYSTIAFFERALRSHNRVKSLTRSEDILFVLQLENENTMCVLLVEEYALGLAQIHRACDEFSGVEHIVTCGNWNGYTQEAKEYGVENGIGIFVLDEFLGALHHSEPIEYVKRDKDGKPVHFYRAA